MEGVSGKGGGITRLTYGASVDEAAEADEETQSARRRAPGAGRAGRGALLCGFRVSGLSAAGLLAGGGKTLNIQRSTLSSAMTEAFFGFLVGVLAAVAVLLWRHAAWQARENEKIRRRLREFHGAEAGISELNQPRPGMCREPWRVRREKQGERGADYPRRSVL
jgi:hypothetical protein